MQSEGNLGFARANNLGASLTSRNKILFLNPDTEFIDGSLDFLAQQLNILPSAGIVGCRLLNSDKTIQSSCIQSFPTPINQFLDSAILRATFPKSPLWGIAPLFKDYSKPSEVQAVSGACLMIKRSVFTEIGGFSEDYFMYGEDLDLCFKVFRAGYKVYYVPMAQLIHHGAGSSAKALSNFANVMMRNSVHCFIRKNHGGFSAFKYRTAIALSALARIALIGPALLCGKRVARYGSRSWHKWFAILLWSLGVRSAPIPTRIALESDKLPNGGAV